MCMCAGLDGLCVCICMFVFLGMESLFGRGYLLKTLNMFVFLDDLFIGLEMFLP